MTPEFIIFLKEWQTLIGALLGVFVASIFSFVGFYLKGIFDRISERKEARRIVEISITRSMNDIDNIKKSLNLFLNRINILISKARYVLNDDTKYFLEETNLPPLTIYLNTELPNLRTKSYYVHNKIIWATAGISSINSSLLEVKQLFTDLSRKNEFLTTTQSTRKEQKETYIANLLDFSFLVKRDLMQSLDIGAKLLCEIKVYNDKMRGQYGFLVRWKNEGTSFKYFKNRKEWKKYYQDLSCIDRIDPSIKDEVNNILSKLTPTK